MPNPLDSQCNRVPLNHMWYIGDERTTADNIEIYGLDNASFDVISSLWIKDKFEMNEGKHKCWNDWDGIKSHDIDDWVVTKPLSGPITMDNICHRDLWWVGADGTYETPEGRIVDIDEGAGNEQMLILEALYEAGISNWHPDAFPYVGEFANLAGARWTYDNSYNKVEDYIHAVKSRFVAVGSLSCDFFKDQIAFFFEGVIPPDFEEESFMDAVNTLSLNGHDNQMGSIIKAAWYIKKVQLKNAREELESILCTKLPEDGPSSFLTLEDSMSRIEDPERQELVRWLIKKFYNLSPEPELKTPEECLGMEPPQYLNKEENECELCEEGTKTFDGVTCIPIKSAEECFNMEPQGTQIVNEDETDCKACEEPTPITKDGLTCVEAEKKTIKKKKKKTEPVKTIPKPPSNKITPTIREPFTKLEEYFMRGIGEYLS